MGEGVVVDLPIDGVSEATQDPKQRPTRRPLLAASGRILGGRRTIFTSVPIDQIRPNPKQPRQHFDEAGIDDLAGSIRTRGVLQPVIVRREADGAYTLIAGERRLRAAHRAGLEQVPALLSDDDLLEVALEENVQREDLSPLEEAEALAALAAERNLSHAELAAIIHKSRPYVSNTLALTRLPGDVKREYFERGAPVSREVLLGIARQSDPEAMRALWRRACLQTLSVRAFREEKLDKEEQTSSVRPVLRGLRKLGRALKHLCGEGYRIDEAEHETVLRRLRRLRKRIDETILALEGGSPALPKAAADLI